MKRHEHTLAQLQNLAFSKNEGGDWYSGTIYLNANTRPYRNLGFIGEYFIHVNPKTNLFDYIDIDLLTNWNGLG